MCFHSCHHGIHSSIQLVALSLNPNYLVWEDGNECTLHHSCQSTICDGNIDKIWKQPKRAKKWWRSEEDLSCRCFRGSGAFGALLPAGCAAASKFCFFFFSCVPTWGRKHFSSIKATLLCKPLTQYLGRHTENSSSFTDTIRELFWLEISKESQRIKACFN